MTLHNQSNGSPASADGPLCVIGAGASGLTAIKNLRQRGFAVECFEREDDVGGNWYYGRPSSAVYRSTHLISSKQLTQYCDYPMPDQWPEYPSHEQALEYLRNYARHFGLYDSIRFQTAVSKVEPDDAAAGRWTVSLESGERRTYGGVVIANGHHWDPLRPEYPGQFSGITLHSHDYKTPDVLAGKRVLVVGGGNSGCDIAVESAQHAARTFHSLRRGYHFVPKFIRGKPADRCGEFLLRWRAPRWLRRMLTARAARIALGSPEDFGLPRPDHKLFETHPVVNSQMIYFVGHGRITPKPEVAELCGDRVRFTDGSVEPVDVIVYATGFRISIPFMEPADLDWHDGKPDFFLNVFSRRYDNLFVVGLIQPDSGLWGLADYQSQLVARFLEAQTRHPRQADWFRRLKRDRTPDLGAGIRYLGTQRHLIEVEHFSYRRRLQKLIGHFG